MQQSLVIRTTNARQTRETAARLASCFVPGELIALIGELGSGKTCFVEGACRGLGYGGRVRSPSFTMLNIYRGNLPIYHFDLYRWDPLHGGHELTEWEEIMDGDGISFVEWADRLGEEIPERAIRVSFNYEGESVRRLEFRAAVQTLTGLRARLAQGVAE